MQYLTNSLRRSDEREVKKPNWGFAHKNVKISQGASKVSKDKKVTPRMVFILGGEDVRTPSHLEDLRATTTRKNRNEP